jgi:1-acyl-sn-glycerol-3-phosphate acyltransferase
VAAGFLRGPRRRVYNRQVFAADSQHGGLPRSQDTLARVWRVARTAVAFACYGVGGLVLGLVILPLERLAGRLVGRPDGDDVRAQRAIHHGSRLFVWIMESLDLLRIRVRGVERLRAGPRLVVANHPSLIDTPLLMRHMPQADFVVSPEWRRNPWLRAAASAAGYLRSEGGDAVVTQAAARLRAGRSVVIYPEGTRSPSGVLGRFQRGAAHIALESGCELLPVVIRVTPRTLTKGQRWSDIPDRRPEWEIEVGDCIDPRKHLDGSEPRPVAARRLTAVLAEYFEKRV